MARTWFISVVVALGAILSLAQGVMADDPYVPPGLFINSNDPAETLTLLDFIWNGGGGNNYWDTSTNWTAPTLPDPEPEYPDPFPTYPNDPGRAEDPDDTGEGGAVRTLTPLIGANLSSALGSDLTVSIGATSPAVASLKMGGTGSAVTTNITGTTGRLLFENGELNDDETNPGDPEAEPDPIEPDPYWTFNQDRALIWSTGTQGSGKENRIDADIQPNDDLDVEGDRALHIYGDIYEGVRDIDPAVTYDPEPHPSTISNLMSGVDSWLYIHGDIHLELYDEDENPTNDSTVDRPFGINTTRGVLPPDEPNPVPPEELPVEYARHNTVLIDGHFMFEDGEDGEAVIELGSFRSQETDDVTGVSTIILAADNSATFDGAVLMDRANIVLDEDNVFGTGSVGTGNPPTYVGFNLIAGHEDRTIANEFDIAQWQTVKGASGIAGIESYGDHSLTISGQITQTNTRGWINLLPEGEELTLAGAQYAIEGGDNNDLERIYTIDGTGKTMVTGGIHNEAPDATYTNRTGHLRVRGTGTIVIDYNESNTADTASNYKGYTWVEGSNLHYATASDLPANTSFLSSSGAVGVDSGVVSNSTFLGKLNSSNSPTSQLATPFFGTWLANTRSVFNTYDDGGLMLASGEYGSSLNFGSGDLAKAANMSLAARETGSTYTGTITPASSLNINPNTYMLGGGSGTLTLPNVQLTGTNKVLVTNGGEVRLEGANTYTGTTTVLGKYTQSMVPEAQADRMLREVEEGATEVPASDIVMSSTLTATNLADGGTASSIGASASAASNLVIQGSTLKYVGGAASIDRLFTVGTSGATIDASGSGALTFESTSALAIDTAEDRIGVMSISVTGGDDNEVFGLTNFNYDPPGSEPLQKVSFNTDDLVPGMAITDTDTYYGTPVQLVDDDSALEITSIAASHVVTVGELDLEEDEDDEEDPPSPWGGITSASTYYIHKIVFGPAPARYLTLAGTNTGDNTLAPLVQDAADRDEAWVVAGVSTPLGGAGGKGSVGIRKEGSGTWVLTNDNTYTGQTQVNAGTLIVNGDQSAATGLTTVAAGATLGGNGTLGGSLIADGIVAPGTSPGTLSVLGDYTQNAAATLAIDIAGSSAYDVLDVTGTADLAGLIDVVLDSFTPTLLDEFDVLLASAVTDSGLALTTAADALWDLTIGADVVTLVYNPDDEPLIGDYNEDDVVDAADYTVWRDNVGESTLPNRDPENSGPIGEDDWASWKAHFGETGGGSGSLAASGAVPEPSTLCLAVLAFLAVACHRRGR